MSANQPQPYPDSMHSANLDRKQIMSTQMQSQKASATQCQTTRKSPEINKIPTSIEEVRLPRLYGCQARIAFKNHIREVKERQQEELRGGRRLEAEDDFEEEKCEIDTNWISAGDPELLLRHFEK